MGTMWTKLIAARAGFSLKADVIRQTVYATIHAKARPKHHAVIDGTASANVPMARATIETASAGGGAQKLDEDTLFKVATPAQNRMWQILWQKE